MRSDVLRFDDFINPCGTFYVFGSCRNVVSSRYKPLHNSLPKRYQEHFSIALSDVDQEVIAESFALVHYMIVCLLIGHSNGSGVSKR